MKQVCIIGAGSSGIAAAKTMKENGISFDCFEKGSDIGGNWRFNNDNGVSSAYRSLHINTNRIAMAYTGFPMPDDYPMYPHHSHIIKYFESYVEHFGIRESITFNTTVTEVSQSPDGTYVVTLDNRETRNYKYIIVANGHHWKPRMPDPGFEGAFTGEIIHSHYYKESEQVKDKDVLIVGIGNSAVDIAAEAARLHTGKVVISTRSGAHITPSWLFSMPFDMLANPFTSKLPLPVQRLTLKLVLWLARGKQEDFGVPKPKRALLSEHPTVSQDLLHLSGRGAIKFKPNIRKFQERTVFFEDGSQQDFDMVIYATGYKISFPFLKHYIEFDIEKNNNIQLYKRVIHPDFPGIFFIGLLQPLGAIMPLAELQTKWIAKIINGDCKLPTKEAMICSIEEDAKKLRKQFDESPRHTLEVDFFGYKSSIEKEMKRAK
ncbi:NAD(P)/FAD-dependent oxidoreductase [Emticicia sp. BO119]|uniref:flavin-containing monooxygenase n=1 Tax=Emticicia sp. BO119 TaxID=2757768 RepID=UPI0015F11E62|nr:NAD(P)-binding domain-containing protein [Emticicia sp. BO119]MBA4851674.1 NAD(P)-binding domain-containing protein [Emticicia sp. BO119]